MDSGNNLALQEEVFKLRSETKEAFDKAKALEARWRQIEKEQKEVYQVLYLSFPESIESHHVFGRVALRSAIPAHASPTRDNGARRRIRSTCISLHPVITFHRPVGGEWEGHRRIREGVQGAAEDIPQAGHMGRSVGCGEG